jgi:hypothetical protein
MKKLILKSFFLFFGLTLLAVVIKLWPYTTEHSETKDGITITEYRRHYALDLHDAGHGRFLDQRVCIDAAKFCVREKFPFYNYPTQNLKVPWVQICDSSTNQWHSFNRFTGKELVCHNCDDEALKCLKPQQNGTWFEDNRVSEVVGYKTKNQTTIRTYLFDNSGVTMTSLPTISGFVYGSETTIAEGFLSDRSKLAWVDCSKTKCDFYTLDFITGTWTKESTPCRFGNKLVIEEIDSFPVINMQYNAQGDEVCLNANGKPAYPFAPIPPPLPQFANLPVLEEAAPKAEPELNKPVIQSEKVQPRPPKKQEEEPEFGD